MERIKVKRAAHAPLLTREEASLAISSLRTGRAPWVRREVLVYGKGPHHQDIAQVVDVKINQNTASGLSLVLCSEVIGRNTATYTIDYNDVVDRDSELPLHIVNRPLLHPFRPRRGYKHPMTFHCKRLAPPIIPPRSITPPPDDSTTHPTRELGPSWLTPYRHESQFWVFESTHKGITASTFSMSATGDFEQRNG
ncbi:hypothetical protein MPER_01356 [Moniliophthora perniciosa FA553]|nr:hypothetical protein MPER_01356 [Moniliophthora perniciosa FA553]